MTEFALGIDVSRWQDDNSTAQKMDFIKSYKAGARFVFIKASQATYMDEDLLFNWKSAKEAGLYRGAYHFLTWDIDPKLQAQYFWSLIYSDPGELEPVVDFEWWGTSIPSNAYDILWQFLEEMKELCGIYPAIYTGAYFWADHSTQAEVWKHYPLWMASYTTLEVMESNLTRLTPWDTWKFWQFTSSGDGIKFGAESKNIDLDHYNGTQADLDAEYGYDLPTPPPDPEPEPAIIELVVQRTVSARRSPNTGGEWVFYRKAGDIVKVIDLKVNSYNSVWALCDDGLWTAIVHGGIVYMT